jgi:hypothetical protein
MTSKKRVEQQCNEGKLFWQNVLRLKRPCIISNNQKWTASCDSYSVAAALPADAFSSFPEGVSNPILTA